MKKILLVALLVGGHLIAQNNASPCKILSKINALIQQEHVQPKPAGHSLLKTFKSRFKDLCL